MPTSDYFTGLLAQMISYSGRRDFAIRIRNWAINATSVRSAVDWFPIIIWYTMPK